MIHKKLSFCDAYLIKNNIIEVIPFEGVEINLDMVNEYHEYFRNTFKESFGVLVNKKYPYSYDFYAQHKIADYKDLKAIAILCYSKNSIISMSTIKSIHEKNKKMEFFYVDKSAAIKWLEIQLKEK